MRQLKAVFLLCIVTVLLAGCSHSGMASKRPNPVSAGEFIEANYQAAMSLQEQLAALPEEYPTLLIATLVNIDALERSSTLGRLVSEQVSARFTRGGYRMVEMKFANSVYVLQNQGELMLTREVHALASAHAAQAVIVGTYGESKDYVLINLKVVEPDTNRILAVYDYSLRMDDNVRQMLRHRRY